MGVPRGRAKLIAAGTVSLIDRRWLADAYIYIYLSLFLLTRDRLVASAPRSREMREPSERKSPAARGNNIRDPVNAGAANGWSGR